MAPARQLLNPVQQEARGLRQKEEDKREKGIARLALQAPIDKKGCVWNPVKSVCPR